MVANYPATFIWAKLSNLNTLIEQSDFFSFFALNFWLSLTYTPRQNRNLFENPRSTTDQAYMAWYTRGRGLMIYKPYQWLLSQSSPNDYIMECMVIIACPGDQISITCMFIENQVLLTEVSRLCAVLGKKCSVSKTCF